MQSVTRTKSRKKRVNQIVMMVREKNKHITVVTVSVISTNSPFQRFAVRIHKLLTKLLY